MKAALLIDLADLWEIQAAMDKDPANTRRRETLRECADTVRMLAAMPPQAEPTMADAIAAGDGTLHGAIDYWQQRALKAEQSEPGTCSHEWRDFYTGPNRTHLICAKCEAKKPAEQSEDGIPAFALRREAIVRAWNDLPESLRSHPGLKALYRALSGAAIAAKEQS